MSKRPTIAYQPALDGVRAVAVIAVLMFHAGVPGFDGGYLGVSIFFTLSGFLITSLLLREHEGTGTVDLPSFYARRLRRLLPASVLCLLGVVLIGAVTDLFDGVVDLRAHVLGAVFQIANWVFLAGDGSYQDLLAQSSGASSPLEHFWSLAIEEQFYWVWPPLMLFVLSRVPRRRGRLVVVGTLTALSAIAAPIIAIAWGPDAAYWATPARLSEILIGAFLAVVLAGRQVSHRFGPVAPFALAALAGCIVAFPSSSGPAYAGALPLIGLLSAGLVLGLQVPGPLRKPLENDAVVWIGKISYGLYLFHWPIFVLLHPDRFSWPGPVLFAVRIAVTLAITVASYELFEQPIRSRGRLGIRVTFTTAAMSTAVVLAATMIMVPGRLGEYWTPDSETVEAAAIDVSDEPLSALVAEPTTTSAAPVESAVVPVPQTAPSTSTPNTAPPTTGGAAVVEQPEIPAFADRRRLPPLPALARPVRIVVTGDSTAQAFGAGLVNWAAEHPELAQVELVTAPGCGFLMGGERRAGDTIGTIEGCDGWVDRFLYPAVDRLQPDVVVAMVTSWDLVDRRWDTEELLTPLDAEFAAHLDADYRALVGRLEELGTGHIAFVRHPIPDPFWVPGVDAQEDPELHAVIYDLYARIAGQNDQVDVVALDVWLRDQGLDESKDFRPDGIHPTPEAAAMVGEDYLGDQLVRVALGVRRT